jgi:hypothetical protein
MSVSSRRNAAILGRTFNIRSMTVREKLGARDSIVAICAHPRPRPARSHLARPLPCVDRTIGVRNLVAPGGLTPRGGLWNSLHIVAIVRPRTPPALLSTPLTSPTTSSPPMAHERAGCTLLKVVAFASRSLFYFLHYIVRPSPNLVINVSLHLSSPRS